MIYICLEIQFIALNKTIFCQRLLLFELMVWMMWIDRWMDSTMNILSIFYDKIQTYQ